MNPEAFNRVCYLSAGILLTSVLIIILSCLLVNDVNIIYLLFTTLFTGLLTMQCYMLYRIFNPKPESERELESLIRVKSKTKTKCAGGCGVSNGDRFNNFLKIFLPAILMIISIVVFAVDINNQYVWIYYFFDEISTIVFVMMIYRIFFDK